jgi:carbohydrate kinase (thermoresistant glucokinase family)
MAELAGIVVMGVSGSGKSTVGVLLAERLGWPFGDADEFHPPANIAKMRSGTPLTDDDRWPWLAAIAAWIDEGRAKGKPRIVGCSALKRRYRDVLIGARRDVRLVYLQGTKAVIAARMAARRDHFMPPALLDSQFASLEEPSPEENALVVGVEGDPAAIVDEIVRRL